ncbi:MAG: class I SAM-dependent methyltransferase [Mesorhizobium sp.]|nr:MAG: class I SAM-dependent methyltransferase [Mesorhizobium sp.]
MDPDAVNSSYRRWAPTYDQTFGAIARRARRRTVDYLNTRAGTVLEVGVGTGLSLQDYDGHLRITGIDFSAEMLAKAERRVVEENLSHVAELQRMDARTLEFSGDHFDTVVAMHLVSVAPEPELVMAEMARVCKPGGEVVIVNHFARHHRGVLARLEKAFVPLADLLGWHSDFRIERVLGAGDLQVQERRALPPFGIFTFLRLQKR